MRTPFETDEEFEARMKVYFDTHAQIVHQLRSRGWERLDAIEEADRILTDRSSDEARRYL